MRGAGFSLILMSPMLESPESDMATTNLDDDMQQLGTNWQYINFRH